MNCSCGEIGPPPDMILSMPPPPLPSFMFPRGAIVAITGNNTQPCIAAFMCQPNFRSGDYGIEFIELSESGNLALENTWLLILISSCVGVLVLGVLLAVILIKCRQYNYSYHQANIKQPTMPALGEPSKTNSYVSGGMLYPCSTSNREAIRHQLANENRLLWATLTPQGTRHFVTEFPPQDGHYEIVDYKSRPHIYTREGVRRTPVKSFDNSGFIDYDYEDPTPLMDSYHDDLDSGYQEPHDVIGSISRGSPRPMVSSPTRIENPNIPPLNMYPHHRYPPDSHHHRNPTGTLNKKTAISRRVSDASSYGAPSV